MSNIKSYKPLSDKVIVSVADKSSEKVVSGIIIAVANDKESKLQEGVVVRVGKGRYESGKRVPMQVKEGDKVLFSKYSYDEIDIDHIKYLILSESAIVSII